MLRRLAVLMILAAMVTLAGACGPPEDGNSSGKRPQEKAQKPTPVETVQVAYKETAAEQTAKTTFNMTMTGPEIDPENTGQPAPMTMTMTGRGAMDFSGSESVTTMEMSGMGAMQVRQVGNVAYTRMPEEFLAQMPGAKPWISVDLDAMYEQQYGASFGQMQGGAASDPARQLEYLRGVSDFVEKVGKEKVRGAQTTHYKAVVNLNKEAAGQDAEVRKAYDQMIKQLGTSRLPVELWLDGQNRVRRYAMDMTMPIPENAASPGAPQGGEMRINMVAEYYDFGTPVNVQAPPKNQTMDGSKMLAAQQQAVSQ